MTSEIVPLRRSIRLTPLVFYGLGTMVEGGFYALVGRAFHGGYRSWAPLPALASSVYGFGRCLRLLGRCAWHRQRVKRRSLSG